MKEHLHQMRIQNSSIAYLKLNGPISSKVKKGARFRLVQDKEKPHVSMVVWEFEDEKIQADIEQLIQQEIAKFVRTLPNKEIHFQGEVTQDFVALK